MKDYLVIIPTYNEETTIEWVIKGVQKNVPFCDIVVVDGNSKDDTQKIVKELGVKLIPHPFKLGYGESLYSGFKYAHNKNYKNVVTIDGDGQHNPIEIKKLISHLKEKGLDMVIGSRYLKDNEYKTSYIRNIGSKILSFTTSTILRKKFTDTTSGFKIFNKKTIDFLLKNDYFSSDYFTADIIIFLILNNFKIDEIPINVNERKYGKSMFTVLPTLYYIYKTILSIFIIIIHFLLFQRIKK
jgi:hypothetical protein